MLLAGCRLLLGVLDMHTGSNQFFSVALFKQDVLVIDSKKGLKKYIKANGDDIDSEMLIDAWETSNAFVYKCTIDNKPWITICIVNKSAASLCHEAVHVAAEIMRNAGIPESDDTEELRAYLVQYVFAETCKIVGIE